ncbi:MAG: DRTGG domain-containing protein [Spirochaetales bacterium]
MRIRELPDALDLEVVQGEFDDGEIMGGYTSDLLSDVMAHAKAGSVLITIQAHKNTVAVASLVGIPAILLANGRPVPEDMLDVARKERIAIFRSRESQFILSGKLYQRLE